MTVHTSSHHSHLVGTHAAFAFHVVPERSGRWWRWRRGWRWGKQCVRTGVPTIGHQLLLSLFRCLCLLQLLIKFLPYLPWCLLRDIPSIQLLVEHIPLLTDRKSHIVHLIIDPRIYRSTVRKLKVSSSRSKITRYFLFHCVLQGTHPRRCLPHILGDLLLRDMGNLKHLFFRLLCFCLQDNRIDFYHILKHLLHRRGRMWFCDGLHHAYDVIFIPLLRRVRVGAGEWWWNCLATHHGTILKRILVRHR